MGTAFVTPYLDTCSGVSEPFVALGNSMAVPVVRWISERIMAAPLPV
jgi:hypothetical protein